MSTVTKQSLDLAQNLTGTLSISSQRLHEEMEKTSNTIQKFYEEARHQIATNAQEISELKSQVTRLVAEKEQLRITMEAEKTANANALKSLQDQINSLVNTISALKLTVNTDHAFLYSHGHNPTSKKTCWSGSPCNL